MSATPSIHHRTGVVVGVHRGPGGIPKHAVPSVAVGPEGLEGDGHNHAKHGGPMQAVSLLDEEDLLDLRDEGFAVGPGATGENVTLRGLDVDRAAIGDRLRFAGGLELELTKRRQPCFVLDAIDPRLKREAVGRVGWYAKVVTPAVLAPGETVELRASAVGDA